MNQKTTRLSNRSDLEDGFFAMEADQILGVDLSENPRKLQKTECLVLGREEQTRVKRETASSSDEIDPLMRIEHGF